jgi:hypothetical protein
MKEVIIVLGRNLDLNFELDKKLPISYLDFFSNQKKLNANNIRINLTSFLDSNINTNSNPIYEIEKNDAQSVYFIEAFYYKLQFKEEVLACVLNTLRTLPSIDFEQSRIFYLCHDAHYVDTGMTEQRVDGDERIETINNLNFYLDTDFSVDEVSIATFYHEEPSCKIFSALKAANINNWKNFDINLLLLKFDSQLLEEQKKKLIDTFLPLTIDMQGLREVSDDNKQEYLDEILRSIQKNEAKISNTWNEIKTVIALKIHDHDKPKEILSETYRFTKEEKKTLYFPLESELNPGIISTNLVNHFKNPAEWEGDKFLPTWLSHIVRKFDEKLLNTIDDNTVS